MSDLQSANCQCRKTLMWLYMGVLYLMLGLAVAILFSVENTARLKVVGSVCTIAGFYFLTLLVIGWRKQERTLRTPPPGSTPSPAPSRTRLPFRIAGIVLAILMLATGCIFLAMLGIEWTDTLKEAGLSLVLAAMGLSAVIFGSLLGYCCVTGKEWPTPATRH